MTVGLKQMKTQTEAPATYGMIDGGKEEHHIYQEILNAAIIIAENAFT